MARLIRSITKKISEISRAERHRMFELLDEYYYGVTKLTFNRDFDEKDAVMLVLDSKTQKIVGFSTFMILDLEADGRIVKGFFSGDTIMDKEYRNSTALGVEIGKNFREALDRYPQHLLYWTLISKGCRTYRLLPLFFHDFYPRYNTETPRNIRMIIDALGRKKYPEYYNPVSGLIEFPDDIETEILKAGPEETTDRRLRDPHIRFFIEQNPGYVRGYELVCVAKISFINFTPIFTRMMRS